MRAIFQHELRGAFHGLAAYLFCAFLLAFVGVGESLNSGEVEYKLAQSIAAFLGRHMES